MSEQNETPAAPWMPTAIDREAEALTKAIEAEFEPAPEPELTATGVQGEPHAQTVEPAAPPPGTPAQAAEGALGDKGKPAELSEFVAREIALFRREEALKAQEDKFRTLEQELTALRSRNLPEDVVEGLRYQTSQTLQALGIDPDFLVKQVLAERMGDKAPEDLRAEVREATRDFETNRKIKALEAKINEQTRTEQARAYYARVTEEARAYLSEPGVNEHAPTVAKVAKSNADLAHSEIMAEIQKDAEFKAMRDPSAPLIPYDEAARRVEKRWATYEKAFAPAQAPAQVQNAPAAPTKTAAKEQPATLTTSRPLAPWLQRPEIEDDGLKAAIAEYRRVSQTQ